MPVSGTLLWISRDETWVANCVMGNFPRRKLCSSAKTCRWSHCHLDTLFLRKTFRQWGALGMSATKLPIVLFPYDRVNGGWEN
jgi:hypothetical protein